jgi:hypothetical protein
MSKDKRQMANTEQHRKLRYSPQEARHAMNLSLDGELIDTARHSLRTYLTASPQEARLFEGLKNVDWMLSTAPMQQAPTDFASKVMASISLAASADAAADAIEATSPTPNHSSALAHGKRRDLRTAVGLLAADLVLLPLVIGVLALLRQAIVDPASIRAALEPAGTFLYTALQTLRFYLEANAVSISIALAAVVASAAVFTGLVGWSVTSSYFQRRGSAVIRIPVIAA